MTTKTTKETMTIKQKKRKVSTIHEKKQRFKTLCKRHTGIK